MGVRFLSDGKLLRSLLLVPVAVGLATVAPGICRADVVTGGSQGYGAQVELGLLGLSVVDLHTAAPGLVATASAPPSTVPVASELVNAELGLTVGLPVGLGVSASIESGVLYGEAQSVTGSGGFSQAAGGADELALSVKSNVLFLGGPIVDITADAIESTSRVSEDSGSLSAVGNSVITDLNISILGGSVIDLDRYLVEIDGEIGFAANTIVEADLIGLAGLEIILNEQLDISDSEGLLGIETNAVRVKADALNILGLNGLSLDIKLGHSMAYAEATAVPEPGTMAALALLGCGAIGKRMRARRRCVATSS